jgi:hypothetical protein
VAVAVVQRRSPALADIIGARRIRTAVMISSGSIPWEVDRGRAEVDVAELALDDVSSTPSRASSSACAWRSWWGANRPALEDRLRHMRLEILGGERPYYNYYLVEAVLVLELRRCGLASGYRGSVLGRLSAAVRQAKRVVSRQARAAAAPYERRDGRRGRTAIISDPPWNPLAYHAFSLALLAQAIELLGPQASAPARALLVDGRVHLPR